MRQRVKTANIASEQTNLFSDTREQTVFRLDGVRQGSVPIRTQRRELRGLSLSRGVRSSRGPARHIVDGSQRSERRMRSRVLGTLSITETVTSPLSAR